MSSIPDSQLALVDYLEEGPDEFITDVVSRVLTDVRRADEVHPAVLTAWEQYKADRSGDLFTTDRSRLHKVDDELDDLDLFTADLEWMDLEESSNIVFFLGAGASIASDVPLVSGLLDGFLERARDAGGARLDPLVAYCERTPDMNIEDLLTAVFLSDYAVSDRRIAELVEQFIGNGEGDWESGTVDYDGQSEDLLEEVSEVLYGLLASEMVPADPNPTHEGVRRIAERYENTAVITTNYDSLMEEELITAGRDTTTYVDDGERSAGGADGGTPLIKMHGSINWSYCSTCNTSTTFEVASLKESYQNDTIGYPVLSPCPHCRGSRRPLLVPPISIKSITFPPLIDVWHAARQTLAEADHVVVVGYSFADADSYISKLIQQVLVENPETTLLNVNPVSGVAENLREQLAPDMDGRSPKTRIIGVQEPGQEYLPALADGMLDAVDRE